jgi:hypothetical protein
MQHGATLKLSPGWVSQTTNIDIQWDDAALSNALPTGKWWGELALLGGAGANEGEWEWDPVYKMLGLTVMVRVSPSLISRHLLAILEPFTFPITTGMTGNGRVVFLVAPTTQTLTFTWEAVASS